MEELFRGSIQHYYSSIMFWWANRAFFEFLLFAYASFLFGGLVLKTLKIDFAHVGERAVYSVMLGYGAFGLVGTFLGAAWLFTADNLRIVLALAFLLSYKEICAHAKSLFSWIYNGAAGSGIKMLFKDHAALKIILLVWILANFLIAFHPVTGNDARIYHLPIIFDIIDKESLTFSSAVDPFYAYLPVGAEVLYAVPTAIFGNKSDPFVFQLVQYSFLVLLLGLFYFLLKGKVEHKLLLLGGLFFALGNFDLQREVLHAGYVDVATFLFGIASSILLIQAFYEDKPAGKFFLSALMLGFALGMKYHALFFGVINLLFLLFYFWRTNETCVKIIRRFSLYGAILILIAGFWYGKNLLVYGNPIYPMFSAESLAEGIAWFVADINFFNFLIFPFLRYGFWFVDDSQSSSQLFILALYALMYAGMAVLLLKKEKIGIAAWLLFVFVQAYTSMLFFVSHQNRFLLPASVMLAPVVVLLADKFLVLCKNGLWGRLGPALYRISGPVLISAFILLFLGNFHYFGVKYLYLLDYYDRETYIREIGGQ